MIDMMMQEWRLEEFMAAWDDRCDLMTPNTDYIKGLTLVGPTTISYYPGKVTCTTEYDVDGGLASELPEIPEDRFAALFSKRVTWSLDDITPYLTCGIGLVSW